jgi:hypothetical protein
MTSRVARFCLLQHTKITISYSKWHKIYQHLPLQDPSKFTQNWYFWFEKTPSGNPGDKFFGKKRRKFYVSLINVGKKE